MVAATLEDVDTPESAGESEAADPSASVPPDAPTLLEIEESLSAEVHATAAPMSKAAHPRFRHRLEAITSV